MVNRNRARKFIFSLCMLFIPLAQADILLVGNKDSATVSFYDLNAAKVIHQVKTGIGPHEIAVSPNGLFAVVVNYGDRGNRGNSISLIDLTQREVIHTTTDDRLSSPHGVQWFSDNQHILVTAENRQSLVKMDPFNGKISNIGNTDAAVSHMLAIAPDESYAVASNLGSADISIIDLSTFKLTKKIATGKGAEGLDISPDGKSIWVTNRADDTVTVIDSETLTIKKQLTSKGFPIRVKVTPDSRLALVSNATANSLSVFDATSLKLKKTLTLNDKNGKPLAMPIGILIDAKGEFAYVAHAGAGLISKINLETLQQVDLLDAGPVPDGMGYVSTIKPPNPPKLSLAHPTDT